MNKTVAVTGASGHIGNVVCRQLLEKGYRVKAFYKNDQAGINGIPVERVQGDLLNLNDLSRLVEGCDIVIHCAALISIHGDPSGIVFKTNTEGALNVLNTSKKYGVRKLIHVSSTHAVSEIPQSTPFDETRPYKLETAYVYDYSKALGEQLVLNESKNTNTEIVVVRPSLVLGPFDFKPSEIGKALMDFYKEKIPAIPQGGYDMVDVRDVAASIVEAIDKGRNGEIYLVTGKYHTLRELSDIIHFVTGKKTPRLVLPYWFLKNCIPLISLYSKLSRTVPQFTIESIDVLKNGHQNMDHSKAAKELGHQCRPLKESIADFYQWQKTQNHYL